MTTLSGLRPTIWAGLFALVLGMPAVVAGPLAAKPLVYVPLGAQGKIVIVDAATDKIVGTIGGVPVIHGLAATPDGRFLVAGSLQEREAGGAAPAKPAGITAEKHAAHHKAAPANRQKAGGVVSTVSVIRTADRSIVRRIDVPGAVHHVAIGPKGRFAVVTHPGKGSISAIDLTSYAVVATVPTGPMPNYAAFGPDGKRVYVSNAGNDTISAIDTGRWTVPWSAVVGKNPEHIVLSRDGATLYVSNAGGGTVSALSLDKRKVVKTFDIGETLHGIDISDDGKTLYVSARGRNKVVSIDLATGAMRGSPPVPAAYHLAVIRGTGKIYVSSAKKPRMWVLNEKTLAVVAVVPIGGRGHQMAQGTGG